MALLVALRTDKAFEDVKKFLTDKAISGFAVREVSGDNEHWHWLLETSYKNVQSFRVNLLKAVPVLKGNASYSATVVKDLDKYERYMCKGDDEGVEPEVAWRHSMKYTEEKITELHEEYWTENRKLKKRKVGSMIDFVVDECKRERIEWKDRSKIGEIYVREILARGKPLNTFSAKSAINTVQCLLCPDDAALKMFAESI